MADQPPGNIILIGYRGSGKTTVGRLLAERLGWAFVDTDALIEARAQTTIADIFATQGQDGFRKREREAIASLAKGEQQVIAAGGGAVMDRRNLEGLRTAGTIIWLTASPEVLWARIKQDRRTAESRPNLTAAGGLDEVRTILAERQASYRQAANLTIDTEHRDPQEAAASIVAAFTQQQR